MMKILTLSSPWRNQRWTVKANSAAPPIAQTVLMMPYRKGQSLAATL